MKIAVVQILARTRNGKLMHLRVDAPDMIIAGIDPGHFQIYISANVIKLYQR